MTRSLRGVAENNNAGESEAPASALTPSSRFLSGIVGLLAGGAGTVAVFATTNDVGTGVLLATGALFLLMATTGHPMTSARLGDNEIRLAREVKRGVQGVLERAPAEVRPELAEVVLESPLPEGDPLKVAARRIAAEAFDHVHYEQAVAEALTRLGFMQVDRQALLGDGPSDMRWDLVGTYRGFLVAVEIKAEPPSRAVLERLMMNASIQMALPATPPPAGVLLIAPKGVPISYDMSMRHGQPLLLVATWTPADGDDALHKLLDDLVDRAAA